MPYRRARCSPRRRCWRIELGPSNVRVNAVVPGWMAGPSVDIYIEMTSTGRGVSPEVVEEELNARVPLGRIPSDSDVAGAIVYLASDLSSAMTGQALDTNGARSSPDPCLRAEGPEEAEETRRRSDTATETKRRRRSDGATRGRGETTECPSVVPDCWSTA